MRDTLVPSMPHTRDEWSMLVAILGTTISPYLFFWQASEEVEEEKAAGQSTLANPDDCNHPQPPRHHAHRDYSPSSRSPSTLSWQVRCDPVYRGHCRRRISCHPNIGGINGIRLRGNAGVAPRPGQETETGTLVLCSYSTLDWSGSRTGLCRHKPSEGTLLDGSHQRIVGTFPPGCNLDCRCGQETDAGPAEFTLGMDRGGDHHSGNVRRGRSHVCCVDCRSRCTVGPHARRILALSFIVPPSWTSAMSYTSAD